MLDRKLNYCIVGLGITGISCLEFLHQNQVQHISVTDLQNTEQLQNFTNKYPEVDFFFGEIYIPEDTDFIILSPGIDRFLPVIQQAILNGAKLTNDINLFIEQLQYLDPNKQIKIVAVTGTNGKTTVVNILANMAKDLGIKYALCGNVGEPVLHYLPTENNWIELYILELSSFQLELIEHLFCEVGCILNITPDHLDRYQDFAGYCATKAKIYHHAKHVVYCREDLNTIPERMGISFGIQYTGEAQDYSLDPNKAYLMHGDLTILPVSEVGLKGEHNMLNVLAALAIGDLLGFNLASMQQVLKSFVGLPHRSQIVGKYADQILWINDSKGTNVGATIAAIRSIVNSTEYHDQNIIIILGGINKNVDLNLLKIPVITYCKAAILIGECKEQLLEILGDHLHCILAEDLFKAVSIAKEIAQPKDLVLLSPACASFDMFDNYQHRGEVFINSILSLYHE